MEAVLILGVLLILVGVIGQVKAKEIEIGTKNPIARIIVGLLGVAVCIIAISKIFDVPLIPDKTSTLTPTHTPTSVPTATEAPSPTPFPTTPVPTTTISNPVLETETPTVTFIPTNTSAPDITPTPTNTPTQIIQQNQVQQIAFVSERVNGIPQIFLMNEYGENLVQLTDEKDGACQPTWNPDGSKILFISPCNRRDDSSYPDAYLFVAEVDSNPTGLIEKFRMRLLISQLGGAFDPVWSNAGIIFTSLESGRPLLYMLDSEGLNKKLVSNRYTSGDRQATWSPDDDMVVFKRDVVNYLYFASITADEWEKPNGDLSRQQVTKNSNGIVDSPDWSPDGDYIAYVTRKCETCSKEIHIIKWDNKGFRPQPIVPVMFDNADPDWSPDGIWIAYASFDAKMKDNRLDIYKIYSSGGGSSINLTDSPDDDYQPAWRP